MTGGIIEKLKNVITGTTAITTFSAIKLLDNWVLNNVTEFGQIYKN
jgi:hypothetical protein